MGTARLNINKALLILLLGVATAVNGCKKEKTHESLNLDGSWKLSSYTETYPLPSGQNETVLQPAPLNNNANNIIISGTSLTLVPSTRYCVDTTSVNQRSTVSGSQYTAFQVKQIDVSGFEVSWKTFTPQQLDHQLYEVQTSVDGEKFCKLYQVTASPAPRDTVNYTAVNGIPPKGAAYYRLKIIYKNNTFSSSPTVKAEYNNQYQLSKKDDSYELSLQYPLLKYYSNISITKESESVLKIKSRAENVKIAGVTRAFGELELTYKRN